MSKLFKISTITKINNYNGVIYVETVQTKKNNKIELLNKNNIFIYPKIGDEVKIYFPQAQVNDIKNLYCELCTAPNQTLTTEGQMQVGISGGKLNLISGANINITKNISDERQKDQDRITQLENCLQAIITAFTSLSTEAQIPASATALNNAISAINQSIGIITTKNTESLDLKTKLDSTFFQ